MPDKNEITVNVIMNEGIFRKFAVFDGLLRQRRWVGLAGFFSILLAFSLVCFFAGPADSKSGLLGCVLLAIGILIPTLYLRMFFASIKAQIKKYGMSEPQPVYTLKLSGEQDGVFIENVRGESARYSWESLYGVYRVSDCIYLYVAENKAFLMPSGQADAADEELWSFLAGILPAEKVHDRINRPKT